MTRRIFCLVLCLCLVAGNALPAYGAEGGTFALAVLTEDGAVIPPTYIRYEAEQTLAQALLASGYTFTGLENGWIQEVEGISGSYSLFYDENGYSLTVEAETVTALCITTKADHYSPEYLALIKTMAAYNASTNGVHSYKNAADAYEAAQKELYNAGAVRAEELRGALFGAMEEYEVFLSGETVTLTLDAGMAVDIRMTGQFGNTYNAQGVTELAVIPGEYTYDLSDGGRNRVRGTVTVDADSTLSVELPSEQWLQSMDLSIANGDAWSAVEKLDEWTFAVPDHAGRNLYPYFVPGDGVDTAQCAMYLGEGSKRVWKSHQTVLTGVLTPNSMEGTGFTLEARRDCGDYEQYQTYPIEILRVPSLSSLAVHSDGTKLPLTFDPEVAEYTLNTTGSSVDILPVARDSVCAVAVGGENLGDGGANVVLVERMTRIPIVVSHENGLSSTYTLNVEKTDSVAVRVETDAEGVEILNEAGASIAPAGGVYALVPGETYTYVTTTNDCYHTAAEFVAAEDLTVHAPAPETGDALQSLKAAAATKAEPFDSDAAFSPDIHEYTYQVGSNETNFGIMAVLAEGFGDWSVSALYQDYRTWNETYAGEKKTVISGPFRAPANFLGVSGVGNVLTLRIEKEADGVRYYQDYIMTAQRRLQLNSMGLSSNGQPLVLEQENGTGGFSKFVTDYTAQVGQTVPELQVDVKLFGSTAGNDSAVKVTVRSGEWSAVLDYTQLPVDEIQTVTVPLDASAASETVALTLEREGAAAQTYTVTLEKLPPVEVKIPVLPEGALVCLTDDVTGKRVLPDQFGTYMLNTGRSYTYVATKYGYITRKDSFIAGGVDEIPVILEEAEKNPLKDIALETDYLSFRGNENNNGITDAPTPIRAEEAVLNWANKIGEGTGSGGVGSPIIVGGELYTYAGSTVFRIDRQTGAVLDSAPMDHASSFSITPPAYGEGMIFIALANGGIQAFNAETLESLWVYKDALGGQPNCPVVYRDGYVYTGFWNAEEKQANYVCVSVTDEQPGQTDESKLASWTYAHNGFYWTGAYVAEGYLLVTTDDGSNGYTTAHGSVLSIDPATGVLLDSLTVSAVGDLRSSVCYDEETDAYYFTSKGGDFYSVRVSGDGTFEDDSLKCLHLTNGTDSEKNPPMSTSTPVVYNGRAYIGVSGTGQFVSYSGHNITVIDLKNWRIAYTVPTQGYPQTSGLLTTAYEEGTEYVYVYFVDNYTPGKLRVIRDTAGQNVLDPLYSTTEEYTDSGRTGTVQAGYVLFTPSGAQADYAICSPIVDEYGSLYFKNDSGYLMCVGSTVTELSVEAQPEKLVYEAGQVFDPTGLKVTAAYANGLKRDVTRFVTFSQEPLTLEDREFTLLYDLGEHQMMYQDQGEEAGAEYYVPTASVDLSVLEDHIWDEGAVTKRPSVLQPGEKTYTCSVCGETKKEEIAKLEACDGSAVCQGSGYTDWVGTGHWAHSAMDYAVSNGLMTGIGGGRFDPDGELTRSMLVTVLWRYAGGEEVEPSGFTDVPEDAWFAKAVAWASKYGIVNGTGGGKFAPEQKISREQIAAIFYRYACYRNIDTSKQGDFSRFEDGEKVSAWASEAVQWATASGVLNGASVQGKLYLRPGDNASRAEAAKLFMNYIELILK